jgi:purine-binding chemotaxis protein CheW
MTTAAPIAKSNAAAATRPEMYLTFKVGDDEFGVPIVRVREIIGILPITQVPDGPDSIRGVINLRGRVIPVMDLRWRFRMDGDTASFPRACIIVAEVQQGGRFVDLGLLVDAVREVFTLEARETHASEDFQATIEQSCIAGLANDESGIKILINVDSLLSTSQLGLTMFDGADASSRSMREASVTPC